MAGQRSSKLETDKRVFTIQQWIITGVQDYIILRDIEKKWKVGRRQSKNLLQKAYKIWYEDQEATVDQKRSLRIAELKELARSMSSSDRKTPRGVSALMSVHKEINKLEALYPARVVKIQGDEEKPLIITNSVQRDARIDALVAKALETK